MMLAYSTQSHRLVENVRLASFFIYPRTECEANRGIHGNRDDAHASALVEHSDISNHAKYDANAAQNRSEGDALHLLALHRHEPV